MKRTDKKISKNPDCSGGVFTWRVAALPIFKWV
jgi:hypothetical protein